jgi:N-acyl-D-amino-acid deacylase
VKPLERCDVLIWGGDVIDGTGAARRRADVAVVGDRIAAIGDLATLEADRRLDARDRVVTPGFIDAHTHDDAALLAAPDMTAKISQGVTSVIAGNCGISLAPIVVDGAPPYPLDSLAGSGWFKFDTFKAYVDALQQAPATVNAALLVGHQTLRLRHMAEIDRPASVDERARMRADIDEAMESGAIGFSTGLGYYTSLAATVAEVVDLATTAAIRGGLYCTHIRDERDGVQEALEEAFAIGRRSGARVILSHHKVAGPNNHGRSKATLQQIHSACGSQDVGLDAYPYTAGSSSMTLEDVEDGVRILITWSQPHPEVAGRDLDDIARGWNCDRREAAARLLPAGGVFFLMEEADVQRILSYPDTMIGSDGLPSDSHPHPRLWGTFAKVLGHYARDVGLFPLEEAVRRMTGLPAERFALPDRGIVREGAFADLVVLDPDGIIDRATYEAPKQPASGIDQVLVNGVPVWSAGSSTGARPGRVLRSDRSRAA